jgi:muramidase (phage lysozyme)/murein DD-endopeptidase MepM/ murein hydrolase activator NlpD
MQLIAKIARCRIADDVFASGDGILLPNITISLGEDQRSSTCSFSVNDPGLLIGAKYREISVSQGGIQVPTELLEDPNKKNASPPTPPAGITTPQGDTSTGKGVSSSDLTPEVKAFLDVIASHEVPNYLSPNSYRSLALTNDLFNSFADHPRVRQRSGRYVSDAAGRYQFLSTSWDRFKKIANVPDFSPKSQDLAAVAYLKTLSAYTAINNGDLEGAIRKSASTWASLPGSPYGQPTQTLAQAKKTYAERLAYYKGQSGSTPTPPPTPDPMSATPAATTPSAPVEIPPPVESSKKGTEIIVELAVGYAATWKDAIAFHMIHTETKTDWDADGKQITTFTGKSIRWLLTRVPVTQSFENIDLKQFTEMQLSGFNLKLDMEGAGLKYQHLSQDGQTPLDLIFREAKRVGFRVADGVGKKSDTLIVEPFARPKFTNLIIDEEILIKPAVFTDKARANQSSAPAATVSAPETGAGETKTAIDRASGSMTQVKPESKTGTGQPSTGGSVTGATAKPVGGTVKPDTTSSATPSPTATPPSTDSDKSTSKVEGPVRITKPDGTTVDTTVTTDQKIEPGKITRTKVTKSIVTKPSNPPQATTKKVVTEVTEGKTKTTTTVNAPGKPPATTIKEEPKVSAEDKKLLEQSKIPSGQSDAAGAGAGAPSNVDPVTGLPNQQAGFIDLRDGRAEAEVIADESRRVKGYEDSYVLVMNMDTLQLVPGQIVALSKRLFPDAFATEKRIGQVDHNFEAGTVTINVYQPQAQLPAGSGSSVIATPSSEPTQFATPAAAPGKFIFPVLKPTTIGDGYGPRASRPPSYRHTILDITANMGAICVAMADGVVSVQPNNGGAGNMMTIQHGGGYTSVFMHGMPGGYIVTSGPVKQGQPIFKVGSTGMSSGPHLHLKFTFNGTYCLLSKIGIDVLKMGLPVRRYNAGCNAY